MLKFKLCDNNIKKKFYKINKKVIGISISNGFKNDLMVIIWLIFSNFELESKYRNLKYD